MTSRLRHYNVILFAGIYILAKVRYRYLLISRYFDIFDSYDTFDTFDIFDIFDTFDTFDSFDAFDTFDTSTSSPFDDDDAKAQYR